MSSTASPASATTTHSTNTQCSVLRRASRKSTLTQQQRNQKRQRATQDQLGTLEEQININPTPSAPIRARIAQDINMTERSVQIWFQNRRAKIKNIAKKSAEAGEDCNEIPDSMRLYLANMATYGDGLMMLGSESCSSKVVIQNFTCQSLNIGSWRRVCQVAMDLIIFYSPDKCCVTYYINNESAGYKIEYPFSYIKNITVDNGDILSNAEGASRRPGGLVVELTRPPIFFMESPGSGFQRCGDFTENQQATHVLLHHLSGHTKTLSGQLAKLVALDSFQKRHMSCVPNAVSFSTPVSPINPRPASQPNHFVHPHIGLYPEDKFSIDLRLGRGHKRQRSRSVPDFSTWGKRSMIAKDAHLESEAVFMPSPEVFAPIPQHNNGCEPVCPDLTIDTSNYGMDFGQYPMSATTINSPLEYGLPAFFANGSSESISTADYDMPYGIPYFPPFPNVFDAAC